MNDIEKTCENCKYEHEDELGVHCRHCIHNATEQFQPKERDTGGWIPCSERLPEVKKEVLIFADDNAMFVGHLMNGGFSVHDGDGWIGLKFILAWMPLPAPFKKEGEQ